MNVIKGVYKFIVKVLTHNYCDSCGFTKDELFITEHFAEAGFKECKRCIIENQIK